ncbi:MAG: hypothetical protein GY940_37905 [bacterium]|nr:hypothetical protein [bacterium]
MRRFSSYGAISPAEHYHAPREALISKACTSLTGNKNSENGHYITVWAPRQCGKSWVMLEAVERIRRTDSYNVGIITMERAKEVKDEEKVLRILIQKLQSTFHISLPSIKEISELPILFSKQYFQKPVILIIDEFDALEEGFINLFSGIFRDMFMDRTNERGIKSKDRTNLLHGLALIGVRSVLGIENVKGSPFNIQQSLHIPNLTDDEVNEMFLWYKKESGQTIEPEVINSLIYELNGQPGLTCWLGELLTDTYNETPDKPITIENFEEAYAAAVKVLPNNNILNIISKAKKEPYRQIILELFKTDRKLAFTFDDPILNYLYMNGVIDRVKENRTDYYVKFPCPFIQKRLFNYFSRDIFPNMGRLHELYANLDNAISKTHLNIPNLLKLYETYLKTNRQWLLKDAPRRSDMQIYEAVYHFNFYSYLKELLTDRGVKVFPEFPTGNGKIDLILTYCGNRYGIELKSFTNEWSYNESLKQAAEYGKQLGLQTIHIVFFVEYSNEQRRKQYETGFADKTTGVTVKPALIETGN